jgi:hypothetical protein
MVPPSRSLWIWGVALMLAGIGVAAVYYPTMQTFCREREYGQSTAMDYGIIDVELVAFLATLMLAAGLVLMVLAGRRESAAAQAL